MEENSIKVLIADASPDQTALLRELFERDGLSVTAAVNSGDEAYEKVLETQPDVLVTDLLLPCLDGLSLLRKLHAESRMPRAIILSAFRTDRMARSAMRLGVDDYLLKPCRADVLIRRIRELMATQEKPGIAVDPLVRRALMEFRVPTHLNGYKYLCEGLHRTIEDHASLQGVTKALYRDIAKVFHTSAACVEHSMRNAVMAGWQSGTPESRRNSFGPAFDGLEKAPSNIQFLSTMAEYIELSESLEFIAAD